MTAISANGQETYENANLMKPELTGTARYIGMGGAMEALGADISTISTNPRASDCSAVRRPTSLSVYPLNRMSPPTVPTIRRCRVSIRPALFIACAPTVIHS